MSVTSSESQRLAAEPPPPPPSLIPQTKTAWPHQATPSECPTVTPRYYCTVLFTENTDKAFQRSFSKLIHFFFFFWHKEILQMDPEINQKPIRFISRHWSRGSHKTQTDRQTASPQTGKNKQGPHSPHSKNLLRGRQGQAGEGEWVQTVLCWGGQWALGAEAGWGGIRHHS